jgi:hypothetical protein
MVYKVIFANIVKEEYEVDAIPKDLFDFIKIHNNKNKLKHRYTHNKGYYSVTGVKIKKDGFELLTRPLSRFRNLMFICEETKIKLKGEDFVTPYKECGSYKIFLFKVTNGVQLDLVFIGDNGKGGFCSFYINKEKELDIE